MQNQIAEPDMIPLNGSTVVVSDLAPNQYEATIAMGEARHIVSDLAPPKPVAPVLGAAMNDDLDPAPAPAPRMGRR